MKVLYHHRTQGQNVEGVHIRGITDALRAQNHQVDIISFPGADPYIGPQTGQKAGQKSLFHRLIKLVTTRLPEFMFEMLEFAYNFITFFRVGHYLRQKRPDFVYERYSLFLFMGVWLAKMTKTPIVLEVNDSVLVVRARHLLFKKFAMAIERWTFCNATGIVFISSHFEKVAREAYGNALAPHIITPNAADINLFSPNEKYRQEKRAKYSIEDKVVCGFVGSFLPWHGIKDFVETIVHQMKSADKLVLMLVGDGAQFEETKAIVEHHQLQDKIIFTGRLSHHEVSKIMCAMDFSVLPNSNTYGSPMKLFESMAMGVPMVCPDYSPILDVVENGKTGWVFQANQMDQLVELTLKLANDPDEVERVSKAARDYIVDQRQWRHNGEQLVDFVKSNANVKAS